MLSERRDLAAARRFFKRAISTRGVPARVVIDKSGANLAGLQAVNVTLRLAGAGQTITIRQVKCLNNILEQDYRFIKRMTGQMLRFEAVHSATTTLAGIKTTHMIGKRNQAEHVSQHLSSRPVRGIIMSVKLQVVCRLIHATEHDAQLSNRQVICLRTSAFLSCIDSGEAVEEKCPVFNLQPALVSGPPQRGFSFSRFWSPSGDSLQTDNIIPVTAVCHGTSCWRRRSPLCTRACRSTGMLC